MRVLFFQQLMIWHCGQRFVPLHELLARTVDLLLEGVAGPQWKEEL